MKTGFVTCVELGLTCMRALYEAGGTLDFAITLPDEKARAKSGRVYIDQFCADYAVPLMKTPTINDQQCVKFLRAHRPDLLFIIGWSQIAGRAVLESVGAAIGMHPTLLPIGRGRASIPWAIIKNLSETGVTMFVLDGGVDTGDILAQQRLPLSPRETATTLYARVADAHAMLMRRTWPDLSAGTLRRVPQDETQATVWPGRTMLDGELHPHMSLTEVDRLVRATTHPYPGAFVRREDGKKLRVWAGQLAEDTPPRANGIRLKFRDGAYDAVEWDLAE